MTELWTDKPPIGAEEVARAEQILQKYKVGKAALAPSIGLRSVRPAHPSTCG